ncbi:MAG: hypothetical protein Q9216_001125 [Gyalolechia sp. 2 TL-2023]
MQPRRSHSDLSHAHQPQQYHTPSQPNFQQEYQDRYQSCCPPQLDSHFHSQPELPFESHLDPQLQFLFENPDQPTPGLQYQCQLKYYVASQPNSPIQLQPETQLQPLLQPHFPISPQFPSPSQAPVLAPASLQSHLPQQLGMQASSVSTQEDARPSKTRLTWEQRRQNHIRSECQRRDDLKAAFTEMVRCVPILSEDSVRNEIQCLSKFIEFSKQQLEKKERLVRELAARGVDVEKVLQVSRLEDRQHSVAVESQPRKKKRVFPQPSAIQHCWVKVGLWEIHRQSLQFFLTFESFEMSSLASLFKRPRSKSEKTHTPSKVVFGDLGTAYASIAQKNVPSTPNLRQAVRGNVSEGFEIHTAWSPIQSPQSEVSPSAPLLNRTSPKAVRASRSSGDPSLHNDYESSLSERKYSQAFDPFASTGQERGSFTTLNSKKNSRDGYFGTSADAEAHLATKAGKPESAGRMKILSANEYPGPQKGQAEACTKLLRAEKPHVYQNKAFDCCGTIHSLSKRHTYGLVGSNDDLRSVRGSHLEADETDKNQTNASSTVEQVEWSPRSSLEVCVPKAAGVIVQHDIGHPPSSPLPRTPQGKEIPRYGGLQEFFTPTEQASRSSESYGNTRQLLDISVPRLPRQPSQGDSFLRDLVHFARVGQSSSSHGNSNKSFATFSIEETQGNVITRPVSQGQFQHLENAISSHLRRGSQASNAAFGGDFVHVGQISFHFPEESEADCGPGSSQTTDSSEIEPNISLSLVQPALRTRNGTPPLLFGGSSRSRRDTDWETIGDSNELTSSIADCSDSPSTSPPKGSLFPDPGNILKHPAHPRYTHSWDLQQDVRSGTFVLTPQYRPSAVSSLPNSHGVTRLALRNDISSYSHPTPLIKDHPNPFVAPAPKIGQSKSAGAIEGGQHDSSDSTANTAAPQLPGAYDPSVIFRTPPLPPKNPSRLLKKLASEEPTELQNIIRPPAPLQNRSVRPNSSSPWQVLASVDAIQTGQGSLAKQQSNQAAAASVGMDLVSGLISPRSRGKRSYVDMLPLCMFDGLTVLEADTESQRDLALPHSAPGSCHDVSGDQGRHKVVSREASAGVPGTNSPESHPFAPEPNPLELGSLASPHINARRAVKIAWTYEQRIARSYLGICGLVPILLPLYIFGWLDVVIRVHTRGQYRAFPANEKRMATGILIVWIVLGAGVVPAITILRSGWWAADWL